jgi:hypothetical protein
VRPPDQPLSLSTLTLIEVQLDFAPAVPGAMQAAVQDESSTGSLVRAFPRESSETANVGVCGYIRTCTMS